MGAGTIPNYCTSDSCINLPGIYKYEYTVVDVNGDPVLATTEVDEFLQGIYGPTPDCGTSIRLHTPKISWILAL
jgi:hypothetical protein